MVIAMSPELDQPQQVQRACWSDAFVIEVDPSVQAQPCEIRLFQFDPKHFRLGSDIVFVGPQTGLEGKVEPSTIDTIRRVTPADLHDTDLASIPTLMRWFIGTYGVHTPAALIHDRLISANRGGKGPVSDVHADRYFRFMLGALGVPLFKRWIIWTAVALRSRWMAGGIKRLSIAVWGLLAVVGLASFCAGIASYVVDADTVLGISRSTLLITAAVMPLLCGFLWGHQFAAAIVAALAVPWILPPTIFAVAGYGVYWSAEAVARRFTT